MKWRRSLSFAVFSVVASLTARPASAQLAPTGGHYANQPTDTGFAGAVNSSGGYGASVPLDLPGARGGLPVPVQIVYGERGVGAAGLGWDVPLSYIYRDRTIAHRRPMPAVNGGWQPREAVSLVLGGRHLDLVQTASGWAARRDAPDILVRQQADGTWIVFDGQGRTYSFTLAAATGPASMWLLKSISGVGGSKVVLDYSITTPTVPGGGGLAIDLTSVSYNPHPSTANCYKNSVGLVYDADAAAPLSLSMLGDRVFVRKHKLIAVNVNSKAACGDADVRLRGYQLDYMVDADTQHPRLERVTVVGREGSTEANAPITLAKYGYGTATTAGKLTYQYAETVLGIAAKQPYTLRTDLAPPLPPGLGYATGQSLVDVTGDGLPEVVTFKPDPRSLTAMFDWMHSSKSDTLANRALTAWPIESRALQQPRYQATKNIEQVWRQTIDVNGDGRIDIIDAHAETGQWVIYLNTPDPLDPRRDRWERRSYSVQVVAGHLQARGFTVDANYVPLAQRTTVREVITKHCLLWDGFAWVERPQGFQQGQCQGPPVEFGSEATFTEWEVTDLNGDGYPDVVFNSSAVLIETLDDPIPDPPSDPSQIQYTTISSVTTAHLPETNQIHGVFNLLGARFDLGSQPYRSTALLQSADSCGVALWGQIDGSNQQQVCGFADVNGDGIADRVNGQTVYLGTGVATDSGFYTPGALLTLPGPLASQFNDQVAACKPPASATTMFATALTAGLRDMTGDGIPDYVTANGGSGSVWIGTGTGFFGPVAVDSPTFALSSQSEDCGGTKSSTVTGRFDVDGDGKADVLGSDGKVYKLVSNGALGAPEAGRLVSVDNGFGAMTIVTYRSAKLLASSHALNELHQVPFPEVVVGSVETVKTQSPDNVLLAKTQYAYGGAQLVFDPVRDAFRFPGYHRHVALRIPTEQVDGKTEGLATLTDIYEPTNTADPYDLVSGPLDEAQRYARALRVGRISDITVLSGSVGTDPSALLTVNATSDARRIASTHYDWNARLFTMTADPAGPEVCPEMVYPYDYAASGAVSSADACRQRGFAFATSTESLRSEPGATPSSGATVTTRTETRAIDDFGRVTSIKQLGDVARTDDDLCVDTSFAAPTGQSVRVFSAPTTQIVTDCGTTIYAKDTWQYDELETGYVSNGLPTAHFVERRSETGVLLGTVQTFDAQFTPEANTVVVRTRREDGAFRRVAARYDDFALAPIILETTATGVPKQRVDLVRDPLSLNVIISRDTNLTLYGTTFDGFDRPSVSTVTPPDGTEGALSCTTYLGFDGNNPGGRNITTKVFTKTVDPKTACDQPGRTATVFLDALGRERQSIVVLGATYPGVTLKADRSYDSLGRLLFASDAYPSTQDATTAYGTTRYFNADGTPWCVIRAKGIKDRPSIENNGPMPTDEGTETYPTCFTRMFQDHTEVLGVRDAASLLAGSPQNGVTQSSYATATGRLLARATWKGSERLEYATFNHDRLGHLASMARYQDAAAGANPATSSWHTDSWGQVLELDEPDTAAQFNLYDSWGELVETNRTQGSSIKRVVQRYDALGRIIHSEHQIDGLVDPETVHDYAYDTAVQVAPQVIATHVLGRLAQATWPTGTVNFSYDGVGRTNARVFTDAQGGLYVEKRTYQDDGNLEALDLYLPDTAYAQEHVDYTYDSAGRGSSVTYNGTDAQNLFQAATIDPFGRVRAATYGPASYAADYADVGRRLLVQVGVSSPLGSRSIKYTGFDPVGRERGRTETKSGASSAAATTWTYDALGRLSSAVQTSGTDTIFNQQFTYDPLGNLLTITNTGILGASNTTLSYSTSDRDRLCRVTFGASNGTACNATYDELGGILSQPTRTGSRQYSYFVDGNVRTITDDHGSSAHFRYDAFGQVQELDVTSNVSPDQRSDRHLGALLTRRLEKTSGSATAAPILNRKIPLHDGSIATRHGPGGPWTFEYGEQRGNRFLTSQTGAFVQDVDYQPFGTPTSTGAPPGSQLYSNKQWNGRDALAAFGLSQLGARLYDPAIGRFISRDALLIARTATTTNPYAFAHNDPVNRSDPSGLEPKDKIQPPPPPDDVYVLWPTIPWPDSDPTSRNDDWGFDIRMHIRRHRIDYSGGFRPPPANVSRNELLIDNINAAFAALEASGLADSIKWTIQKDWEQIWLKYYEQGCSLCEGLAAPSRFHRLTSEITPAEKLGVVMGLAGFATGPLRAGLARLRPTSPSSGPTGPSPVESSAATSSAEAAAQSAGQAPNRIYSARELIRRAAEPGPFHNFPESFNQDIFGQGTRTVTPNFWRTAKPGLSNDSVMYKMSGTVNGVDGTFELGVRPSLSGKTEVIMHRFFRPNP